MYSIDRDLEITFMGEMWQNEKALLGQNSNK